MGIIELNKATNARALTLISSVTSAKDLAYLAKSFRDTATVDQSVLESLYDRGEILLSTATDVKDIAYIVKAMNDIVSNHDEDLTSEAYKTFKADGVGSGVASIPNYLLPVGYRKLYGHDIPAHENHGKVVDSRGSVFFYIAPFYYNGLTNTPTVSNIPQTGYVMPMAFIREPKGFLFSQFLLGKEDDKLVSKQFLDPCSTNSAHNPTPTGGVNTYAGFIDATLNAGYVTPTIFQWEVIRIISEYLGKSAFTSSIIAFKSVTPFFPKGNNNNALADVNEPSSVKFQRSGYSNCALTGSGSNLAKTTHNGQNCGIADVNGNMWKIVTGLTYLAKTGATCADGGTNVAMTAHGLAVNDVIYFGGTPTSGSTYNTDAYTVTAVADANNFTVGTALSREILATDGVYSPRFFRILKTSVKANSLTSANLLTENNYDLLDLTGIVASNSGQVLLGNGTEVVRNFSTDVNSLAYKLASTLIPTANGTSVAGTIEFGNDYFYKYLRHGLVVIVGGNWGASAGAGVLTASLSYYSSASSDSVGGFASVSLL